MMSGISPAKNVVMIQEKVPFLKKEIKLVGDVVILSKEIIVIVHCVKD